MVVYNYSGKEINAKIVYYGPALSGKTTNLEWIYSKIPTEYSGKMVSLRTQADRTIFFDFLPLELGLIDGFKTRFMLYTVPGQVYYNATRKMVLKGVDGVVFVADSEAGRIDDNLESFENLKDNLTELGIDPATLPMVLQWNKRDLPNIDEIAQLEQRINEFKAPAFEASAPTGQGVYETLHRISQVVYQKLTMGEQASVSELSDSGDPEDSLFGAAIAAKLQEIDHPIHHERLAIDELDPDEPMDETPVLDSILGGGAKQGAASDTMTATQPVARPAAPQARPATPGPEQQQQAARAALGGDGSEGDEMVSELVDQVLGQLDDEKIGAVGTGGGGPTGQAPKSPPPPKSQSVDIQVELDPPAPQSGLEDPDQPLIEHDVDPFESGSGPKSGLSSDLEGAAADDDEALDLITDPLRKSSTHSGSTSGAKEPAPAPASGPLSGSPSDAKVLEIPVTVDVDALRDGRAIKIVLTLRG